MLPLIRNICVKIIVWVILDASPINTEFNLIVPSHTVIGLAGHDVILPCVLSSHASAVSMSVRWFRHGEFLDYLYLYESKKISARKGSEHRVSLLTQQLERGNVSLLLKDLRMADAGRYLCHVSEQEEAREEPIDLEIIQHGSVPRISLVRHHKSSVQFSCRSHSWYPQPHMIWIDHRGQELMSATIERTSSSKPELLHSVTSTVNVEGGQWEEIFCVVTSQDREYKLESTIQIAEEYYKESAFERAYVSVFAISIFLGLTSIAASLLHVRRAKTEKEEDLEKQKRAQTEKEEDLEKQKRDDVMLDADTAHGRLKLSEDKKSVSFGELDRQKTQTDKRFIHKTCVLGEAGYDSGRHYWEFNLSNKTQWSIGIIQEPTKEQRKAKNEQTYPENGCWSICFDKELKTVEKNPKIFPSVLKPDKLGVFLDYDKRTIAFFNVEKKYYIHCVTANFKGKLFPLIGPLKGCEKSLKISSVKRGPHKTENDTVSSTAD
ncbi:butyrophilin subfamily 1 member A1-like [Lampris incognitus]|uniref:butyrophilin subfamily 1 member A1-like n=1 Tax=Lampris incognitus TaxID=2546036 RepID=UPI0024B52BB6|nr:butyrophilin subfamily 1 member A1-like [Lampris incognitus]